MKFHVAAAKATGQDGSQGDFRARAGKVHRSDSMQIRVPDMKGVDKWWKGCKKRNAPSGMGGMPKHVTNRLPVADLQTAARVASFYHY